MADVLIRSFSKILSLLVGPNNVAIDNWTFQMFYKVTPMLLGACVILVCTREELFNRNTLQLNSDWGQILKTTRIILVLGNCPTLPVLYSYLNSIWKIISIRNRNSGKTQRDFNQTILFKFLSFCNSCTWYWQERRKDWWYMLDIQVNQLNDFFVITLIWFLRGVVKSLQREGDTY